MTGSMSQLEAPFRLPEAPVEADLVAKYFRGLGEPTRLRANQFAGWLHFPVRAVASSA